ncbi:MAG: amidohydrolase family protein [Synergistales bacterium]|nr:amidohydrolase family protein [Synergistales bacterium]
MDSNARQHGTKAFAIRADRFYDGRAHTATEGGALLVEDGRILEIRPGDAAIPEGFRVVDAPGTTVMPGLIDTHTHVQLSRGRGELEQLTEGVPCKTLRCAANARELLEAGFTTVRDLGAEDGVDIALRDAVADGLVPGPRMLVSGYKIMPTGADFPVYPPHLAVAERHTMDSPDEVRKAVRTLLAMGVDVIKLMTSGRTFRKSSSPDAYALNLEEARTAVEEAHNQNVPVSCHAHGSRGVKVALQAGCDTLEHGTVLDDEDIRTMLDQGTILVPTLSYGKRMEQYGPSSGLPGYAVEKAVRSRRRRLASLKKALEAGVTVAMGSDSGMPFIPNGENAYELEALQEAGMPLAQVLRSATSTAASTIGLGDETGALREGLRADILVVRGNPFDDLRLLQDRSAILAVYKEGVLAAGRWTEPGAEHRSAETEGTVK